MLPYPTALATVLGQRFDWGTEAVPLLLSRGRVLADDLLADRPLPPFDRVMLDGVAVDHRRYAAGQRAFRIAGTHAAGAPAVELTDATTVWEVMTGSVLPKGATAVVRVEDLRREGDMVVLPEGIADGHGVHATGTDGRAGEVLLPAGTVVTPAATGVLASVGQATVRVRRLPRVAVVATGDELVDVGQSPAPHQLRRSNDVAVASLLATAGITADRFHLRDERASLAAKLTTTLHDYDAVILSGGVSRGKFDYVPEVLAELGVRRLLHRVAQRPGKPLWVGRTGRTMVFGLPGNPVSTLAGTVVYVGAWLRACLGVEAPARRARLDRDLAFAPDLTLFKTVCLSGADGDGAATCTPVGGGSGDYAGAARATGFLVLPQAQPGFRRGVAYDYLPHGTLLP